MRNKKLIGNEFELIGENILITPFSINNLCESYVSWLNDIDVVRYSNQRFKRHDIHSCNDYFLSFNDTENLFLAIYSKSNKNFIGTSTVYYSVLHKVADIGLMIGDKQYWGKGFGSEAWIMVMDYLIDSGLVRKVTGGALSCNVGMINIMKKAEMLPDGKRTGHQLVDNVPVDIVYFSKFNDG